MARVRKECKNSKILRAEHVNTEVKTTLEAVNKLMNCVKFECVEHQFEMLSKNEK